METARSEQDGLSTRIGRVARRLALVSAAGPLIGVPWGLASGGSLGMYSLLVASNSMALSMPCFAIREMMGTLVPEPLSSTISGALGGGLVTGYFAGIRGVPKGVVVFGLAGFSLERGLMLIEEWRLARREEIIRDRSRAIKVE